MSSHNLKGSPIYITDKGPQTPKALREPSSQQTLESKNQKLINNTNSPKSSKLNSPPPPSKPEQLTQSPSTNTALTNMSDGKNEARALRVLEIMNDFRTLQVHITSLVTRSDANPPDQAAYYLSGYVVLRQCNADAQAILATHYNPGSIGYDPSRQPDTEVQKATLQRIILDASTRRFQAHKIYLRAAAGMRWIQTRQQATASNLPANKKAQAMQAVDNRLQQELTNITDESVVNDLRGADTRKGYWLVEDPSLARMLEWIRRQR